MVLGLVGDGLAQSFSLCCGDKSGHSSCRGGQRGSQREAGMGKAQNAEFAGSGYRVGRGWF